MATPFTAIGYILVYLELVCNTLNFEPPLFLADAALNNRVGGHFRFHLTSKVIMSVVSSIIKLFIDHVIVFLVGMNNIGQVSTTIEVTIDIICIFVNAGIFRSDDRLSEFKLVLKRDLREFEQQLADALSEACLDFAGRQVKLDSKFLQLQKNVLTGGLWIIILAPVLYLVVV